MPSTCSHARWALTEYASMGCPEGSIRKKQKHLAPRMAWVGTTASKAGAGWHCSALGEMGLERRLQRAALGLYSELVIDPWMLGHDTQWSWRLPCGCAAAASQPLGPNPINWAYWLFYWRCWGLMGTRAAHFIKDCGRRDDASSLCQEPGSLHAWPDPGNQALLHPWGRGAGHKMLAWAHRSVALRCRVSTACQKPCSY